MGSRSIRKGRSRKSRRRRKGRRRGVRRGGINQKKVNVNACFLYIGISKVQENRL
jgi:hypothetical protein